MHHQEAAKPVLTVCLAQLLLLLLTVRRPSLVT
jgi:hypothetical protein